MIMTKEQLNKAEKCLATLLLTSKRETEKGGRIDFYQGRYVGAKILMNELGYIVHEGDGCPVIYPKYGGVK